MSRYLSHPAIRQKLLVVDDQRLTVQIIQEIFRASCDVLTAQNGEQALQLCQNEHPDLVLLDVIMPGISGHEVCRRLKADEATRDIPVIFLTGQSDSEDEAQGFELGAVDFISKPIHPVIVRARVETHLALKQQRDILQSLALLDGLTGVANRRKYEADFVMHWRHCMRVKMPLSLIMLDVDHFKKYNDHYGHQEGDDCLKSLAHCLKLAIKRPHDLLARYGGEEFVVLLPDTNSSGAGHVAEKMLAAVESLQISHVNTESGVISISLGVATITPDADSSTRDLMEAADAQLYKAKNAGRARVCVIELD